ncbi:MAG: InlB B-repeat-containing protein, partial [Clostridia bacterium]|nr:InlB B-repeat-containing protein [Clostridia bacterium]
TNKKGASMKGYAYPKEYSAWYTEEKECTLSTKGLSCPGYTFEGWYTESACTNKKVKTSTSDYGAIRVYAKWKQASGNEVMSEETATNNTEQTDESTTTNKASVKDNNSTWENKKDNAKKAVSTMITKVKKEMIK